MCQMPSFMAISVNKFSINSRPAFLILLSQRLYVCLISLSTVFDKCHMLGLIGSRLSPSVWVSDRRNQIPRCLFFGMDRILRTCFCMWMTWCSLDLARRFYNTSSTSYVLSSRSRTLANSDSSLASASDAHRLTSSCHSSSMLKIFLITPACLTVSLP